MRIDVRGRPVSGLQTAARWALAAGLVLVAWALWSCGVRLPRRGS